jgi:threonine 3-dehydrogenase
MKAIVKRNLGPGLEVVEVDMPAVGPGDVLVKVRIAGICGTDLHIYSWDEWSAHRIKPPLILGHEFCGDVVEVGREVRGVKVGDFVTAECHLTCGQCYQCKTGQAHVCSNVRVCGIDRDGSFGEYIVMPEQYVWELASDIPEEIGAIFDPIGNAVHTVLAGEIAGTTVAVVGCGPIGLAAIPIARAAGATQIVGFDISDYRLGIALKVGADSVVDSSKENDLEAAMEMTGGVGFDVVLEMSGYAPAIRDAFKIARAGGRVSLLGLPKSTVELDLGNDLVMKGLFVQGIHGRRMFKTWYQATRLIQSHRVDLSPIITHRMRFEEIDRAMEVMASGKCGKVLLYPGGK